MNIKSHLLILLASGALALPVCAQVPSAPGAAAAATSPAAPAAEASPAPGKDRFGGFVSAVDATAKTITVDNKSKGSRTFQFTDTTLAADSTDKAVTLADVKVGDRIHGSYKAEADGKLDLLKIKVGMPSKKDKEVKSEKK